MASAPPNPFRQHRESLGLTMRSVARALNVANESVWRWEHGQGSPRKRYWVDLAAVLNVSVDEIARWVNELELRAVKRGVA